MTLLATDPSGDFYQSYDYRCFLLLGLALIYLRNSGLGLEAPQPCREQQPAANRADFANTRCGQNSSTLRYYNNPRHDSDKKLLNDWFDALKTLRFVHEAAKYYPDTSLRQTLQIVAAVAAQQNYVQHGNRVESHAL